MSKINLKKSFLLVFSLFLVSFSQSPKLQIYYMDVGQADGEVIRSPKGEVVLIDGGKDKDGNCSNQIAFMKKIGIKKINYMVASHYHSDHIECTKEILSNFPLSNNAKVYDRGNIYKSKVYQEYVAAIGTHRTTAEVSTPILLDNGDVKIDIVALNGDGIETSNENDLSVVCVLHYGQFDAEFGGDLSFCQTMTTDSQD
jgi:competence protein ComEC